VTITLTSLVARLTADVPAVAGVPSASQYEQAVKDAVADLSRRASVPRVALLTIVAGTASYSLPSDFQRLIRLAQIGVLVPYQPPALSWGEYPQGGTLVTPQGLVPFSGSYREQITVTGATLTIYPTPTTSADRQLVYAAGDALNDAGDAYDTLTEDRASIALLLAKATCLERIGLSSGGGTGAVKKITAGGDATEFSDPAASARTDASGLRTEYLAAIQSLNAAIGGLG
jgi:hypothetical protein